MTETWILSVDCSKCFHRWKPFGNSRYMIPITKNVVCPKCDNKFEYCWYDSETSKKLKQKELGLSSDQENDELRKRFDLLQKELEIEKGKRELYESRLKQIEDWKKVREKDFETIEQFAKEIDEDKEFREKNK